MLGPGPNGLVAVDLNPDCSVDRGTGSDWFVDHTSTKLDEERIDMRNKKSIAVLAALAFAMTLMIAVGSSAQNATSVRTDPSNAGRRA